MERAQAHISSHGLDDNITIRLADGLCGIQKDDVDTVTICGMGGKLMKDIIEAGKDRLSNGMQLILSPQSEVREFRAYLLENGIDILSEMMIKDEGKYYFIMDCVYHDMAETTHRMAQAGLEKRPFMVRFAESRAGKEEILASLSAQGVTAEETATGSGVYRLTGVDYPESLDALREGLIRIQDLSSSLAGDAAGIKEGDFVLDVCGAPGGKGLHAADLLYGTGQVEIRDVSDYKVSLIKENIACSGCTNVSACAWNACEFDASMEQKADVVIADLPCSGLGIIGRKPDIKYHTDIEKIEQLASLQREILTVVQEYVKPGGTLVYSTCTISRPENEENAAWFEKNFPFVREGSAKQLLPGIDGTDGFFMVKFRKKL